MTDMLISVAGMIGMSLDGFYTRPCSLSYVNVQAAERHTQFEVGWFLEPIFTGSYPTAMRQRVPASRLPAFTPAQQQEVRSEYPYMLYPTRERLPTMGAQHGC